MYSWGKRSKRNIATTYYLLQELANRIIRRTKVDICVLDNGGKRTAAEQHEIYLEGNSRCDGYVKISYHQTGLAIDFVPYIKGRPTWRNKRAFLHIARIAFEEWERMNTGKYYLHWGGYWRAKDLDGDGILEITDRLGWDMAHFELRKCPQKKGVYPVDKAA